MEKRDGERQELVDSVIEQRPGASSREMKVKAEVEGRPKHLYSIYEKMVLRGKEFNEIYDLVGIRVLVDSVRDCYAALGAMHAAVEAGARPVQGLHRDAQVQHVPVAAHDRDRTRGRSRSSSRSGPRRCTARPNTASPPTGATRSGEGDRRDRAELAWLGRVIEWQQEMADPREFMEGLKIDLYAGQVFVFTPKGDVVDLPAGSTPIDFAYAIHTEVGHRCVGARVNGRLVPLDYELQTGDSVEILTSKAQDAAPSRDWLSSSSRPRARTKIRQWFSRERREDALETRPRPPAAVRSASSRSRSAAWSTDALMAQVAADLSYPGIDALYVAIGEGHVSPQSMVSRLSRLVSEDLEEEAEEIPAARRSSSPRWAAVMVAGPQRRVGEAGTVLHAGARGRDRRVRDPRPGRVRAPHRLPQRGRLRAGARPVHRGVVEGRGAPPRSPSRSRSRRWTGTKLLRDVATVLGDLHVNIVIGVEQLGEGPDRRPSGSRSSSPTSPTCPASSGRQAGGRRVRRLPGRPGLTVRRAEPS